MLVADTTHPVQHICRVVNLPPAHFNEVWKNWNGTGILLNGRENQPKCLDGVLKTPHHDV